MALRLPLCSALDCPVRQSSFTPYSETFSASSLRPRLALPPSSPSLMAWPPSSPASKPSSNPPRFPSHPPPEQGTPRFVGYRTVPLACFLILSPRKDGPVLHASV